MKTLDVSECREIHLVPVQLKLHTTETHKVFSTIKLSLVLLLSILIKLGLIRATDMLQTNQTSLLYSKQ